MSAINPLVLTGNNIDLTAVRAQLEIAKAEIEALQSLIDDLADVAMSGSYADLSDTPVPPVLADVATSGDYADLLNKPALAAVATSGQYGDLLGKPALAAVAASGAYADLTGKPALGSAAAADAGTGAGEVLQLDGAGKIPAVDGSQLTGLTNGLLLARTHHAFSTAVSTASTIPDDNTKPQSGEGAALTSVVHVRPGGALATNLLRVTVIVPLTVSANSLALVTAFKDAEADAFMTIPVIPNSTFYHVGVGRAVIAAGGVGNVTISLRYGNVAGSTTYVNQNGGGARWNGTLRTIIEVEEYAAP